MDLVPGMVSYVWFIPHQNRDLRDALY
jgi:hypothetical protein